MRYCDKPHWLTRLYMLLVLHALMECIVFAKSVWSQCHSTNSYPLATFPRNTNSCHGSEFPIILSRCNVCMSSLPFCWNRINIIIFPVTASTHLPTCILYLNLCSVMKLKICTQNRSTILMICYLCFSVLSLPHKMLHSIEPCFCHHSKNDLNNCPIHFGGDGK